MKKVQRREKKHVIHHVTQPRGPGGVGCDGNTNPSPERKKSAKEIQKSKMMQQITLIKKKRKKQLPCRRNELESSTKLASNIC